MNLKRREFLRYGGLIGCAGAAGMLSRPVRADAASPIPDPTPLCKRVALRNLHTGEELEVDFRRGPDYVPEAMAQINQVLRDFRSGELHAIDPMLMDYLWDAAADLGVDPVFGVISGYRSAQTNELLRAQSSGVALRSLHMEGRAIDVRLTGVDCALLATHAEGLARGGVGFYRTSDFVHLDTGACRTWRG